MAIPPIFPPAGAGQPCCRRSTGEAFCLGNPRYGPMLHGFFESFLAGDMTRTSLQAGGWRTPSLVIGSGCLIALIAFGPRSTLGFFLTPMSTSHHWGRDVFAFALALQNLLWGIGQPLGGIIADRFGTVRVICGGALLYACGLVLMSHATSAPILDASAGVLIGFGLAGCSFPVVIAAFGKILPKEWRSVAFGFGTASGSFGQFLYSP